jgi:transcriptional regulator with XRE-family HTH domain
MGKVGGWPPSGFGQQLRRLRDGSGLTQAELAERAGIHPNTMARMERGEHEPAWPLVLALARALGVTADAFMPAEEPATAVEAQAEEKPAKAKGKGKAAGKGRKRK